MNFFIPKDKTVTILPMPQKDPDPENPLGFPLHWTPTIESGYMAWQQGENLTCPICDEIERRKKIDKKEK
jgi:hypothetical protein